MKKILLLFVCALLTELFVCNFRHFESLRGHYPENGDKTRQLIAEDMELGSGYSYLRGNTFLVVGDELEIEIRGIDEELATACIEIQAVGDLREGRIPVRIRQWAKDESHRLYYELPGREIWKNEKRSSYITYHLYGKCTDLRIVPDVSIGKTISVSITLNPVIPLFFSWERALFLFSLAVFIYLLRPASPLHRIKYSDLGPLKRKAALGLFFAIHLILFWRLMRLNPYFQTEDAVNQRQYQELAESLKAGSFSLLEEPPGTLQEMENPYDMEYRNQVMAEAGEWYSWDHAYYNGKYYVYFGVVPAVLFYLPYYLITGTHLHNNVLIFGLSLIFMAGSLGVVHEMIRRWFPKATVGLWYILNELLLLGSGMIYMTKRPDLYTVPILSGLSFGMLGLWCFLLAKAGERISLKYLCLGSLFMALIAGCRPQLFLFMLPAAVLLWKSVGRTVNREALLVSAAFILPMALVAAGLMYYNYSRFGSVFDFGANYNLTMNDMRNRGFHFDRIPLGIFACLFQPVKMTQKFPFMEAVYFDSQYMGVTIQEATYGGAFMTNLFSWFGLTPLFFHRYFKGRGRTPMLFAGLCLLAAGIIIVADTSMSGILYRYFQDFSVFLMLASVAAVFLILERLPDFGHGSRFLERMVLWGLLICLLWQMSYQGMTFFLDTGESLQELRPDLYSHVKYLVNFWV